MPIIEVNHATKEYRLGHMKSLKQSVLGVMDRLRGRPVPKQEPFKALDDIDFKVDICLLQGIQIKNLYDLNFVEKSLQPTTP